MARKTALVILTDGFEEMEAVGPIDLLRRAGIEVATASQSGRLPVKGRSGIVLQADAALAEVMDKDYDLIILPGGPGHTRLRSDKKIIERLRRQEASGRLIGAICAAPAVLLEAGLLENRGYTAHFSVENELTEIEKDKPVVTDNRVITSRGAGTATEFALELVKLLAGREKAAEIAGSIHYQPASNTGNGKFPLEYIS